MKQNVKSYLVCDSFHSQIFDDLSKRYKCSKYKNIIVVEIDNGYIVVFDYGVYVTWDIEYDSLKFFEEIITQNKIDSVEEIIVDEFESKMGDAFSILFDTIVVDKENIETKIAISAAIAQNTKLMQYESEVTQSIEQSSSIPKTLAKSGKINLSKKQVAQKIGELFIVKSKINLHYDLLDTPEFFWDYPEYESYYEKLSKYLEIKPRVDVLNKKVEVIQELLDMLQADQQHRYSSFLEWIIIILIAVEIAMSVWDHFIK